MREARGPPCGERKASTAFPLRDAGSFARGVPDDAAVSEGDRYVRHRRKLRVVSHEYQRRLARLVDAEQEFDPATKAKLLHGVGLVHLDGFYAHVEPCRQLLIAMPLRQQA